MNETGNTANVEKQQVATGKRVEYDPLSEGTRKIRLLLGCAAPAFQRRVLAAATKQVDALLAPADGIAAMVDEIAAVIARIDVRERAKITMLQETYLVVDGWLSGEQHDLLNDLQFNMLGDEGVEKALADFPEDADLQTMGKVWRLAQAIEEADWPTLELTASKIVDDALGETDESDEAE